MATARTTPLTEEEKKKRAHDNYIKNKEHRLEQQRVRRKEVRDGTRVIKHRDGTFSGNEQAMEKAQGYRDNYAAKIKADKAKLNKTRERKADWAKKKKAEKVQKLLEEYEKKYPEG
jgi:hypothetical protein